MNPTVDFIAEMEAIGNVCDVNVFRRANNLSVKLQILFESKRIGNLHKVCRPTKPWSISTYDMANGFGYTVEKDSWKQHCGKIHRTIEKVSSLDVSIGTHEVRLHSIPGVSRIFEDDNGYRLCMIHRDLFSDTSLKFGDWKSYQLLNLDTKHMLDHSLEDTYMHYLSERAERDGVSLPPRPPYSSPCMKVTYAEIIQWYRNLYGAHATGPQDPYQIRAEKLPSGEFFVQPLPFNSRKEYFRTILGLQPIRKIVAALVLLLAIEVYASLTAHDTERRALARNLSNAGIFVDVPKLISSDSDSSVDITTVAAVPPVRGKVDNDMIHRVDRIDRVIDERYRDYYDPSIRPSVSQ